MIIDKLDVVFIYMKELLNSNKDAKNMGHEIKGCASGDDDAVVIVSDIDPIEVPSTEKHLKNDIEYEPTNMVYMKTEYESSNISLERSYLTSSRTDYTVKEELNCDDNGYQPDTEVSTTNSEISISKVGRGSIKTSNQVKKYSVQQKKTRNFHNIAIKKNTNRNFLPCNVINCKFKYKDSKDLTGHSSQHSNDIINSSEKCDFKSELPIFSKIHSTLQPVYCEGAAYSCNKGDHELRLMPASGISQSADKRFSCDKCSFQCRLPHHLKRHALIHNSEKLFVCDICGFTSKRDLRKHRLSHEDNKLYSCDECEVKVKSLNNLKRHKMTHSDEKPFSCDECNFRCKAAGNLKIHKMIHNEEMPFCCHLCSFKCRNSSNLKAHMIVHKDDRRFACDLCDFRCKRFCHLKEHKVLHSDARPFICDKCGFKCKRLSYLRTHKMIHEDVSPYACDLCSFKSKRAGNLKAHILTHGGEERFSCDKCEYKCRLLKDWNCHNKDHEK